MRIALLVATVVLVRAHGQQAEAPRIHRVEPATAKAGVIVSAFGSNLGRSVGDLILSRTDRTALTHIVHREDNVIRFRIPRSLPSGRYQISLVILNRPGKGMVDQNVSIDVLGSSVSAHTDQRSAPTYTYTGTEAE
jgi:hypothetical protein